MSTDNYKFELSGQNILAVYELEHGQWEQKSIDWGEQWSFDGRYVTETEQERGYLEVTTYADADNDGVFQELTETYDLSGIGLTSTASTLETSSVYHDVEDHHEVEYLDSGHHGAEYSVLEGSMVEGANVYELAAHERADTHEFTEVIEHDSLNRVEQLPVSDSHEFEDDEHEYGEHYSIDSDSDDDGYMDVDSEGHPYFSMSLGASDVMRLYDTDDNGDLDYFEVTRNQNGDEQIERGEVTYGSNSSITMTARGIGGSTPYSKQAQLTYSVDGVLTGLEATAGANTLKTGRSMIDFDDIDDPESVEGDYDDFEYDMDEGSLNPFYLASMYFDVVDADDAMHLYDRDDDGEPDYYETSWMDDVTGIKHREYGQVAINTNGTATLTGLGMGGATTLHSETVDLAYDVEGQLTGLVSTTGIAANRMGMIDYSDDDDPEYVSGNYDDFEYDLDKGSLAPSYLASMYFDAADTDDAMHLYDTDDDGEMDHYQTSWVDDVTGIKHREHGQVTINTNGTATLAGLGMGGATTLYSETADLAYDVDGQLTGLVSVTGIAASRMGMIDFSDDDDPLSVGEGYEFEDLYYDHDHVFSTAMTGYLTSLHVVDGDDVHLYDSDGDGSLDRFESSWREGGREHVEHGEILLGAGNTVTLVGKGDAGHESFTETADLIFDADGQMVGLAMAATGGTRATAQVRTWDHDILEGVEFDDDHVSDALGEAAFHRMVAATDFSLMPTATTSLMNNAAGAVDLNDSISILKMIVGLDRASSEYQVAAADLDENGVVDLQDAIGVLKHVIGLSVPAPSWSFVSAGTAVANVETLEVHHTFGSAINQDVSTDSVVELIGILRGDVDGSWEAMG